MSQGSSLRKRTVMRIVGWMLLLTGIIGSGVPIGLTVYFKAQGSDVGAEQAATWSSDEPAVVMSNGERPSTSNECTVTPEHGEPRQESMRWGALADPPASGTATITCEHAGVLVTGTEARILSTTYNLGALIVFMLFVGILGVIFLLPPYWFSGMTTVRDRLSGRAAKRDAEERFFLD